MKCDDGFEWLKKKVFGIDGFIEKLQVGSEDPIQPVIDVEHPELNQYALPAGTKRVYVKGTIDGTLAAAGSIEFQDANGKIYAKANVSANKKHMLLDALFVFDPVTGTVADYGFFVENTSETVSPSTPLLVTSNLNHYIMLDAHDFSAMIIKIPAGLENNLEISAYPN